ncbi:MAG: Calx-beta domain-containing protein [Acidimicrobiia bacterium]
MAVVVGTTVAATLVGVGPASAATSITAPTGNPFTVPGDVSGNPTPFTVSVAGFPATTNVYIEQCDGNLPTALGWDPTTNCDLGSSPAPVVADGAGNATFDLADANHAFHPFKGSSPQGLFNCLSPNDPSPNNGLTDFRNCQFRISSNNTAGTSDQVFRTMALPDDPGNPPPSVKVGIGDAGVLEGNTGTRLATFTVSLSQSSLSPVTVDFATVAGTATAGSDYGDKTGQVTIPAGMTAKTIGIKVKGNAIVEPDETFKVKLSNPVGATFAHKTGTGTIFNDDPPVAGTRVGIGNAGVVEGSAGKRSLALTVSLSSVAATSVSVSYATTAGTATLATDFSAKSGTLTIAAGKTSGLIKIPVKGDASVEPNETFKVKLSSPLGAVIDRKTGTGKILNDD